MLTKLKSYEDTVCNPYAGLAKVLDPRFPSNLAFDYAVLRPMIQRSYPIVTNEIQDDGSRKSTFLLDVLD